MGFELDRALTLLCQLPFEHHAERPSLSSRRGILGWPRQDTLSLSSVCQAPGVHSTLSHTDEFGDDNLQVGL